MFTHAHSKGLLLKPALVALYKWNRLRLEPEQPITFAKLYKRSSYTCEKSLIHEVDFV